MSIREFQNSKFSKFNISIRLEPFHSSKPAQCFACQRFAAMSHYPEKPSHRPDVFNIALLKTGKLYFHLINPPVELTSDHSLIILDLNFNASRASPPKPSHVTDWEKFEKSTSLTRYRQAMVLQLEDHNKSFKNLSNSIFKQIHLSNVKN